MKLALGIIIGVVLAGGAFAVIEWGVGDGPPTTTSASKAKSKTPKQLDAELAAIEVQAAPALAKLRREWDKRAITFRQYLTVRLHQTRDHIESRFGQPRSSDVPTGLDETCTYYNQMGKWHTSDSFQFCFNSNRVLVSKDQ